MTNTTNATAAQITAEGMLDRLAELMDRDARDCRENWYEGGREAHDARLTTANALYLVAMVTDGRMSLDEAEEIATHAARGSNGDAFVAAFTTALDLLGA